MKRRVIPAAALLLSSLAQAAGEVPDAAGQAPAKAPVPAAASPAAVPPSGAVTLRLEEGHLLSQDLEAWAGSQGLRPLWNSPRDFRIFTAITLSGSDRYEVLSQLGQLLRSENYGLVLRLYEKNSVLVIDSR